MPLLVLALAVPAAHGARDMEQILSAVVGVRSQIPDTARTAETLGTHRTGSGVVIDGDGLVLTIGYLVLEAEQVFVATRPGDVPEVSARVVAYDHATGFGLLRAEAPLDVTPMNLGDSDALSLGAPLVVASYGGSSGARPGVLVDRREFAGYWEYLLEGALFAAPPHPLFGGAALIDPQGDLVGIGSLIVSDARRGGEPLPGNMFVPVNRLKPILAELLSTGRGPGPRQPWIGIYSTEVEGSVIVRRVAVDGPAGRAGVTRGSIVESVAGQPVSGIADFYRKLWAAGGPGTRIVLGLREIDGTPREVAVTADDRYEWLRLR
ncbi:MAG: serine protease [Myxococcales bacterium]|nr:serine protease [Myxococcales bacterium]